MKSYIVLCLFSFGLLFISCEEIPPEIPPYETPTSDKVILIEEITGVRCPNCPEGQALVEELLTKYPENLLSVTIHTEFLGNPWPDSKYNFITDEGEAIEDEIGLYFGKPSVSINRQLFEGEQLRWLSLQKPWEAYVQKELEEFADFHITVNNDYDAETRELNTEVEIEAQLDISGQYSLSVMVLESHIIDVQEDSEGIVPDYEHNHVLRTMLTPALGVSIPNEYNTLETINRSFNYTLPEEDGSWVAQNMTILAFLTQFNFDCSCTTVVQAGQAKLLK